MERCCRPPGWPSAGWSRRAPRLHRGSRAQESVPGPRLPLLPAGGGAVQRLMSAALGAGPGAATATRGSAHQVRRVNEAADWWSRGGGRAHGGRCARQRPCGPGHREAYAPGLECALGTRARAGRGPAEQKKKGLYLRPAGPRRGREPRHESLPELTSSHRLGCVYPRPPHRGHPDSSANRRCSRRTTGAAPDRDRPPFLKSAAPTFPRVGKVSALQRNLGKGAGPENVLNPSRCL